MKIGQQFWELNVVNGYGHIYPRYIQTKNHISYYNKRKGIYTFPDKESAEKALKKYNKKLDKA